MNSPLKYYGGKHYLAKRIIELMPPHLHYVEPYFGSGAVLFARDVKRDWFEGGKGWDGRAEQRGCSEVINDLNAELMGFWYVLQDEELFRKFKRIIDSTPLSQLAFEQSKERAKTRLDRAVSTFIRFRQSRMGMGKSFATLSRNRTRGRVNEQVKSWWGAVDGLEEARERLKNVVVLCDEATRVIRSQDGKNTCFYLDPPYVRDSRHSVGQFEYEMSDKAHESLLVTLTDIKGKFLLSGYRNRIYDLFAKEYDWRRVDVKIDNKASSAGKKKQMTECIWMNY